MAHGVQKNGARRAPECIINYECSVDTAHVASRHARPLKAKFAKQNPNVGATLAILERQLRAGNCEYLTQAWRDWLESVHIDGSYGDANTGRAFRLLQDYEFPT
jgi:hypothetical protein